MAGHLWNRAAHVDIDDIDRIRIEHINCAGDCLGITAKYLDSDRPLSGVGYEQVECFLAPQTQGLCAYKRNVSERDSEGFEISRNAISVMPDIGPSTRALGISTEPILALVLSIIQKRVFRFWLRVPASCPR
jgi:hypothetical protein